MSRHRHRLIHFDIACEVTRQGSDDKLIQMKPFRLVKQDKLIFIKIKYFFY